MFDNLKIMSKKLNATFKISVYIPDNYDKTDDIFEALYIVSGSNPFVNENYDIEKILKEKSIIGVAIYPNIDITKNKMLYNIFNDKYDFSKLYHDFIIYDVKHFIEEKYRVFKNHRNNYILGIKDTAILAYSLSYHYTNEFDKVFLFDLDENSFHKLFMTDLKSKFNPNISFNYSMKNNTNALEIKSILQMFGCIEYNYCEGNLDLLLKNL